jgi:uncharacterized protein (DUF2141 family)
MTPRRPQPHPPRNSIELALILATAPAALAQEAASGSLTVTFQGIKTPAGAVMVNLSASPEGYAGKALPVDQAGIAVGARTASITFHGLKPGSYAIRAFHDLNGDGELNTNPFGIPTEPYAFSNNARGAMGPARWDAAAFQIKAGQNRQTIDID